MLYRTIPIKSKPCKLVVDRRFIEINKSSEQKRKIVILVVKKMIYRFTEKSKAVHIIPTYEARTRECET